MTGKILVVDDEPLLEYVIKQFFRQAISARELDFDFADNGAKALEKLQAGEAFDMVLTDIKMPAMDGLSLLEQLPAIDPTLKAVVLSAYGDMPNIRTAMNRGAFDFLTKPIDFQDLKATITKTLGFVQRIREQERQLAQATQQLRYQACYDALTGLANRYWFLEQARQALKVDPPSESSNLEAVLLISLNRYQVVKYSVGHEAAEQLLVQVANRLLETVGSAGLVARVGEDAFAIWLAGLLESQEALNLASQLQKVLKQPFNLGGSAVFSGLSTGIAFSTTGIREPEDLLRAADAAMHEAQIGHLSTPVVFDVAMERRAVARLILESDLQQAILLRNAEANVLPELHLNYQPIVSLPAGKLVGFEALARWHHPQRGLISPAEFIPVAEKAGLIGPLGDWVLVQALQQIKQWRTQSPQNEQLSVSVNLSGLQLFDPDLLPRLDELLASQQLSGDCLKLEITESVLMENAEAAASVLEELQARQIQVCLDDFGTGYSNLSYLQSLPVDLLKIDRSFISDLEAEGKNYALVKAILMLAGSLGMEVVAEGVEALPQVSLLLPLGCHYCQGYFFSRPLSVEAATTLLQEKHAQEVWAKAITP